MYGASLLVSSPASCRKFDLYGDRTCLSGAFSSQWRLMHKDMLEVMKMVGSSCGTTWNMMITPVKQPWKGLCPASPFPVPSFQVSRAGQCMKAVFLWPDQD